MSMGKCLLPGDHALEALQTVREEADKTGKPVPVRLVGVTLCLPVLVLTALRAWLIAFACQSSL